MKKLVSILCLFAFVSVADAQSQVPQWVLDASVKVNHFTHADSSGISGPAGSGTIIGFDKELKKCYVLTNYHVIGSAGISDYIVTADNKKYPAKFVATSPRSDLSVLEIDSTGIQHWVAVADCSPNPGTKIVQCGYGQGIRRTRSGGILGFLSRSKSTVFDHWNLSVAMTVIQGDSGSGLFNIDTKELVGVVWGCNPSSGETQCIGAEDCRQFLEVCLPRIFQRRNGGGLFPLFPSQRQTQPMPYPGVGNNNCPGGVCPQQPQPWQPNTVPSNPQPGLDPVQANSLVMQVRTQAEALDKLVGVTQKLSESVTDLSAKIAAVEKSSKCNCLAPVTGGTASPPAALPSGCNCDKTKSEAKDKATDDRMKQVEDDLAKLRASLKRSGYVRIQLEPK